MVTAVQVKSYLQPLLEQNDDLALVGRLLFVKPVCHVLRGVLVDRRSSAHCIVPTWFMFHLFGPYPSYFLSWGGELYSRRFKGWRTTHSEVAESLREEIELIALPTLRAIRTLEDFVVAVPATRGGHLWSIDPEGKSLIDIAMGELEQARASCREKICNRPDPGPKEADVTKAEVAGAKLLCGLLEKNDIEGLIRTLHAWEEANVKKLKLAPYWEATPFPVELKLQAR